MLISQPLNSCLTNHSKLCMSRLRNNQSRRISIYRRQRRPSFGFESSVSSTMLTVMTLWLIRNVAKKLCVTCRTLTLRWPWNMQLYLFKD